MKERQKLLRPQSNGVHIINIEPSLKHNQHQMSHILLSSENQTAGKLRQVLVNFRKDEQQWELTWSEGFVEYRSSRITSCL